MNYYEEMEVSVNASEEVIKNAYRALIKKYHPDSYTGDKRYAEEKMKKITVAYETLINEEKRLAYDIEQGFKEDPNAPQEDVVNVDNYDVDIVNKGQNKDNEVETKKETDKEKKKKFSLKQIAGIVGIGIIFILAFYIGIKLANNDKSENISEIENTKEEKDVSNGSNSNYNPNNYYTNTSNNNGKDKNDLDKETNNSSSENSTNSTDSNEKFGDINSSVENDVTIPNENDYIVTEPNMGES